MPHYPTPAASFNYEVKNSYSIRLQSADAGDLFTQKVFTITVSDVYEPAPVNPYSPSDNITLTITRPVFYWPTTEGAKKYRLEIYRNGKKYKKLTVRSTSWTPPKKGLPVGEYKWRVGTGKNTKHMVWSDRNYFTRI